MAANGCWNLCYMGWVGSVPSREVTLTERCLPSRRPPGEIVPPIGNSIRGWGARPGYVAFAAERMLCCVRNYIEPLYYTAASAHVCSQTWVQVER